MSEYSVLFKRRCLGDRPVDDQLNLYLMKHTDLSVKTVSYSCPKGTCLENLLVVFNQDSRKVVTGEQVLQQE